MALIFANIAILDSYFLCRPSLRKLKMTYAIMAVSQTQGIKVDGDQRLLSYSTQNYRQYFDIYFEEVTKCRYDASNR